MRRLLTMDEIKAVRTIGRDEEARTTSIGLTELDAVCDALEEALVLEKKLQQSRRPKPDFAGTRFHHFNDVATIAVRQYRDNPDEVAVGIAMLALPRYYTRSGVPIDLLAAGAILNPGSIAEPGDQFNRTLGRLISHGRAVKLRGLANVWSLSYAHHAILDLRRTEKAMVAKPWQDVGLLRLQYRSWTISRAILQHEIRSILG